MIKQLSWFDIHSLRQFLQFIKKNKHNAIEIARIIGASYKPESGDEKLHGAICVFYLCYAELIERHEDFPGITEYLSYFHIGKDDDDIEQFSKELLRIREKLYV